MQNSYFNANEAFNDLWNYIPGQGQDFDNTKAIFNCGFYIQNPLDNHIKNPIRDWKPDYAEAEWQWYLSGDRNIDRLGEIYGKVHLFGVEWQILMVMLIVIMVGNGIEIIK